MIKINVGEARTKKTVAAFPTILAAHDAEGKLRSVREITMTDLDFSGLIDFMNPAAFVEDTTKAGVTPGTFKMQDWTGIGAELLIKGKGSVEGNSVTLEIFVYAVHTGRQLLAKRYKANEESIRKMAHTVSNDIMFALSGKKGPFTSKIAFVSDKTGRKEIYVMDYDGFNPIKVTSRFAHAMSPAWSPDGKDIVFTAVAKLADQPLSDSGGRCRIDLDHLERADSSVLALLLRWLRRERKRGVTLVITGFSEQLRSLIDLYDLDEIFAAA